ncbi:hypothetical protein H072_6588 [Dactylellina haptotyla CBS 200.50]|uniref:Uncharacterized protein n=1 Tax=Dactylellina haptotyla (strain CBS 200.50) TaxID=1284197 RepID=S8BJY4_DACHA|nr:hypothetical protein H072_6588 [Dactylellina haptotyla CBS 200.50]
MSAQFTPENLSLAGKVAIVTGSGRENGIGAAIAKAFARNGAAVMIHHVSDSSRPRAEKIVAGLRAQGAKADLVQGDVSVPEDAAKIVNETLRLLKTDHIDILVNNAGWSHGMYKSMDATPDIVHKEFGINVFGPLYLVQQTIPHMPHGGRIINIGSVASKMGLDMAGIYGAAKAAQDALTYAMAMEFGKSHGVTVNTIAPGPVQTDQAQKALGVTSQEQYEQITGAWVASTRAAARVGTAEDIADLALLVTSEKARWLTGQFISASGGMTGL